MARSKVAKSWEYLREPDFLRIHTVHVHASNTYCCSGDGKLTRDRKTVLVDDCAVGIALYNLENLNRFRTIPIPRANLPQGQIRKHGLALYECESMVLCGSDHGVVYVNGLDGRAIDEIDVGCNDLVHTLTVNSLNSYTREVLMVLWI